MIEVLEPGLLTTVQDSGRPGLAHLGISIGGAADPFSFFIANQLVGNGGDEAALEMTLKGCSLKFERASLIALTGSDFKPTLDDEPIPLWKTTPVKAGQVLRMGMTKEGPRCYLAIAGGIDVPVVLQSRSHSISAGFGGFQGKPLRMGDRFSLQETATRDNLILEAQYHFKYEETTEIGFLPGRDWESLTEESRKEILANTFTVTDQANRNGVRLTGPQLRLTDYSERLTEGVSWGTVQLPASGSPLILMNEQTTTGGYPAILQIIQRDLYKLGQLKPQNRIRFVLMTVENATELLRRHEQMKKRSVIRSISRG